MPAMTHDEWRDKAGALPVLIDHIAFDRVRDGVSPANAVAEAFRTLDHVSRTGRTQYDYKVPFRTRHACRDACEEWHATEFLCGVTESYRVEESLLRKLDEAAGSMAKATVHEPLGKPGGPGLWHHKGMQLPAYIQHIAKDIMEKRGMPMSRAIAIAVGAVKRWARGGGNVEASTRAAAAKAVAEWEAAKAKAKARRATEADEFNSGLVKAVSRMKHVVQPIPDGATFAVRYGNRLNVIEGLLSSLRADRPLAIRNAQALLEAATDDVDVLAAALRERRVEFMIVLEALGYGTTVRARTDEKHKGRFHGMHGVQRAVRRRDLLPDPDEREPVAALADVDAVEDAPVTDAPLTPVEQQAQEDEKLVAEAAPALAPAGEQSNNPAFNGLHPRASGGTFTNKAGDAPVKAAGSTDGVSPVQPNEHGLADAIRDNDPAWHELQKQLAATAEYRKRHPTGEQALVQKAISTARDSLMNIGYADDQQGISQFQRDYGMKVTGKLDPATLLTISNVYRSNVATTAAKGADFTGLPGSGIVKGVRGTPVSGRPGRTTLGKTSRAQMREAVVITGFARNGVPFVWSPSPGENHANGSSVSGDRQPGGDDYDFDEPAVEPPNLRDHEGNHACDTCVHFSSHGFVNQLGSFSGCMMWSYPVDRSELCDTWMTLTPPDAPLVFQEARLQEAEQARDTMEITKARAVVRVLKERLGDVPPLPHPANSELARMLEERDVGLEERKSLAKKGQTFRGTSYPIRSLKDLDNAVQAYGRANESQRSALKGYLRRQAKRLGASQAMLDRIARLGSGGD